MMIFAAVIFLITINCSADGLTTRTMTATIIVYEFMRGGEESVMFKAEDTYNQKEGTGTLVIKSSKEALSTPDAFKLNAAISGACLVRGYYCKTGSPVWITVPDWSEISRKVANTKDTVKLEILPFVEGKFLTSNSEGCWEVRIPYLTYIPAIAFTEVTTQLILQNKLTKSFCCTMTSFGHDKIWLSLKIKKAEAVDSFMKLKYLRTAIFLDIDNKLEEKSAEPTQANKKSVVQARIVYAEDWEDKYYAEIKLQPEDTVVMITTEDTTNPVRLVHGFLNEKRNKIMFFRGSQVSVPSTKEGEGNVPVTHDVSWAFTGAKSLQVTTVTSEGGMGDFSDMKFAKLIKKKFQYANGLGTLMVLPWEAPLKPKLSRLIGCVKSVSN